MGIAAKAGEKSSVQFNVVAVKARDLKRYDVVLCGGGVVRTVEEAATSDGIALGHATARTRVSWLGTFGYMFVGADEVFWTQQHEVRLFTPGIN